jgi:hypothetical protein
MITFKQFIQEKAMNPSEFKKTEGRQKSNTLVGFEFECIVPGNSDLLADSPDNREYVSLHNIDSLAEINEYFEMSRADVRTIEREYNNYSEEDELSFDEFVESEYGSIYRLVKDNGFEPKFGWEADTKNDSSRVYISEHPEGGSEVVKQTFVNIEDSLSDALGVKATVEYKSRSAHAKAKDWLITSDQSIKGKEGDVGVEIISPPTPLGEALEDLKTMFEWMKHHSVETNITTGLHINLSMPNIKDIDLVKLVLFAGESHVMKAFDRIANSYTNPQIRSIINNVTGNGTLPKEASEMIALAKQNLSSNKYSSVNIEKIKDGYLEFRMAGNVDYHKDFKKVRETVLRFVSAIESAVDPEAERNEYLKKLTKMLGKADENNQVPGISDKSILNLLADESFDNMSKDIKAKMDKAKSAEKPSKIDPAWVEKLVYDTYLAFKSASIKEPSLKQKAEFKVILKRLGININEVKPTNPKELAWVIKAFNLK